MRAVKNKDKGVPVTGKDQPIVESVPTFHVFPETPQANSRVEVGLILGLAGPLHCLQHLRHPLVGQSLHAASEG